MINENLTYSTCLWITTVEPQKQTGKLCRCNGFNRLRGTATCHEEQLCCLLTFGLLRLLAILVGFSIACDGVFKSSNKKNYLTK